MTRPTNSRAALRALLVVLALFALAARAAVAGAPAVRDVRTLPTLAGTLRTATPLNAIVSTSDSFLVRSNGFDVVPGGGCDPRGWTGEDRSHEVYAHVTPGRSVNEQFFAGLQPTWGAPGEPLPAPAATTPIFFPGQLAMADGGAVVFVEGTTTSARLVSVDPIGGGTLSLYAPITTLPVVAMAFDPAHHRMIVAENVGLHVYPGNGDAGWMLGGTGAVFVDTTLAAARIEAKGLAVDAAGNIYFTENINSACRVRMVRTDGRVVTIATGPPGFAGDGGPIGAARFSELGDLAVNPSGTTLYVCDGGNDRVRRLDLVTRTVSTAAGPDSLYRLNSVAISDSDLLISHERKVLRWSAGVPILLAGPSSWFGPAADSAKALQQCLGNPTWVRSDGAGGAYFTDYSLRLVFHLAADGTLSTVAGAPVSMTMGDRSLWFGADMSSAPAEVSRWVKPSGFGNGWSQRLTSPAFSTANAATSVVSFDAMVQLRQGYYAVASGNRFVTVQALAGNGTWVSLVTHVMAEDAYENAIEFIDGTARLKARVNLGESSAVWGPTTRLRFVVQTPMSGSQEDGLGGDTPDGALVLDNVTVRDAGGDLLPPLDFEDGTTGGWTLSAANGAYPASGGWIAYWMREPGPTTNVQLTDRFDFTDPTCAWSFVAEGDSLNHGGLYARLTSPWMAISRATERPVLISFSGKLPNKNSGRLLGVWVRGKNAGDARPRLFSPSYFSFNSAQYGNDTSSPWIDQRVLTYPMDFQGGEPVDSIQVVFEAQDQSENLDPIFFPAGVTIQATTKLPLLDDLRVSQMRVDRDHDGVADAVDACPDSCAAGQDADGDGCPDPTSTMRHVESWDQADLPIHYTISAHGDPAVHDGSDVVAITNGFQAWTQVPGADLSIERDLPTAQTLASAADGVNLVTFEDDYPFSPNVIAVTPTLSALKRTSYNDRIVLPGQIVDADLMLNPQIPFRTSSYNPGPGSVDLQSVVTHEAGHVLGLSHSGVLASTMFFVLQPGDGASTLEADDRAAIASAYPAADFATRFATITGQVVRGGTGAAIPGALVTAVRLGSGGALVDSVSSDYTDEGGHFALRGLGAGSYSVRVTPLDGEVGGYGLTPDYISDRVYAVAQTNFAAEWWCEPESDRDTPEQRGAIALAAGGRRDGVVVITNVDTIPPAVVSVNPGNLATGVHIDSPILLNFSERIDGQTLAGNVRLHEPAQTGSVGLLGSLVNGGRSVVITPTQMLKFGTTYQLDLGTGLADREGVPLAAPFASAFTTEPAPPVQITGLQPQPVYTGSYLTITGSGFDPAGGDTVVFSGPNVVPVSVTPGSMIARVPTSAVTGTIHVKVHDQLSNSLSVTILAPPPVTAPSRVADVNLPFAPTDVVVSPDAAYAYAVGSGGIAAVNLGTGAVETGAIGAGGSIALTPDGHTALVTRHAPGDVARIGTDPGNPGTWLQELGRTPLPPGSEPATVAILPSGAGAFVTDPGARVVYRVDLRAGATRDSVIGEMRDTLVTPSGLAVSPDGKEIVIGGANAGPRHVVLPDSAYAIGTAASRGGAAVAPTGLEALFAGAGLFGDQLLYERPVEGTAGALPLGGDVRDVAFGPDGRVGYAANAGFDQLQMVDTDPGSPTYHKTLAAVAAGTLPVAVAVGASGDVIALANSGSHSLTIYRTGGTNALVRVSPPVGRPGDVVTVHGTGAGLFAAGSLLDLGGGSITPLRMLNGVDATFAVPSGFQRDASLAATDPAGARTLGIPFRVVDPIPDPAPHETGFGRLLDSLSNPVYGVTPGRFASLALSPDGRQIAVLRRTDFADGALDIALAGEDGLHRLGESLLKEPGMGGLGNPYGYVGLEYTRDGDQLWISTPGGITRLDTDPASPAFGLIQGTLGVFGPMASDPVGRYMMVYDAVGRVWFWTPAGDTVAVVPAPPTAASIAAGARPIQPTPDGRWLIVAGDSAIALLDVDARVPFLTIPHGPVAGGDWSVAVTSNGRRAVVKFPSALTGANQVIGVYNLDSSAGAIGQVLYQGAALGANGHVRDVLPAPDGAQVLLTLTDRDSLALLDPATSPPTVRYLPSRRVGPAVLSDDGRRLWTEAGAGTTRDSLRLVSLGPARSIALVSGGNQSAQPSQWLPSALRFRVTDALGRPQVGAVLRFDGVGGAKPILDSWDCPLWHVTDTNGEVSVRWMLPSTPGTDSLIVSLLDNPGAQVRTAAQVVLSDAELPPAITDLRPLPGATDLNRTTAVSVTFNKAMEPASLASHLRLFANGGPVAGSFSSVENRTFLFQPAVPLAYAARCSLVVDAGVADPYALTTAAGSVSVFTIQSPPALQIASLSPPAAVAGVPVVIAGTGFSPTPGQNTVLFNGTLATVTAVGPGSLTATVPLAATSGPVTVQTGNQVSNGIPFFVMDPGAGPGGVIGNLPTAQGVRDVAITYDGSRAYVTNPTANSVTALDIAGAATIAAITVGLEPQAIAILPDDSRAYVVNTGSDDVSAIDIRPASVTYHQVIATIPVGDGPVAIAVSAVGPKVVVANGGSGTISLIDANPGNATFDQVTGTVNVGSSGGATAVVVSPDGARAFVATLHDTVYVVDLHADAVTGTVNVGSSGGATAVTVAPDGATLYVLCGNGTIKIVNIAAGAGQYQVTGTVNVGSGGGNTAIAVAPDGALLYVTGADGSVTVFSITQTNVAGAVVVTPGLQITLTPVATIPVGSAPAGIDIDPSHGAFALVCNAGDGTISVIGFPGGLPPLAAEFDFDPNTLNLKSMGKWVSGYLEPEPPLDPATIVLSTVRLNGTVPADTSAGATVGDHDADGIPDLEVKFLRQAVSLALPEGERVPVTATGTMGTRLFVGRDTIQVKRAKVLSPAARDVVGPGQRYAVRWEVSAEVAARWVAVLHTFDRGATWTLDATGLPNTGSYSWTVPIAVADSARVAVVLVESADSTGSNVTGVLGVSEPFEVFGTTEVEPAPTVLSFERVRPNPAIGQALMRFGLPRAADVSLHVYDVTGRRVRTLAEGRAVAGWHEVRWDGRTEGGSRLSPGLYFVRFRAEGRTFDQRLVWLR